MPPILKGFILKYLYWAVGDIDSDEDLVSIAKKTKLILLQQCPEIKNEIQHLS